MEARHDCVRISIIEDSRNEASDPAEATGHASGLSLEWITLGV